MVSIKSRERDGASGLIRYPIKSGSSCLDLRCKIGPLDLRTNHWAMSVYIICRHQGHKEITVKPTANGR